MNKHAHMADTALKNMEAPRFTNPEQEKRLLAELVQTLGMAPQPEPVHPRTPRRLIWAGTAAVAVVALVLASRSLVTPKSVWAEVLKELEQVQSLLILTTAYPEEGSGKQPAKMGDFYYRKGVGGALVSPLTKAWIIGGDMYNYDIGSNKLSIIRGTGNPPVLALLSRSKILGGYGEEHDHGVVTRDGADYRLIEMTHPDDSTERIELLLDPESELLLRMLTYHRNKAAEPWRLAMETDLTYNPVIDDAVFAPDYPQDAEIVERDAAPSETYAALAKAQNRPPDQAWMDSAAAITWHGDKYLAVQDVWLYPSGWIGLKFRTNLYDPFVIPAGFTKDPVNQERWNADAFMLNQWASGNLVLGDGKLRYFRQNRMATSRYGDGSVGHTGYYLAYRNPSPSEGWVDVSPRELNFKTLAFVRDKGRGESYRGYGDWKKEPEQWQLFELTVPVPEASTEAPDNFNKKDLAWRHKTQVDKRTREDWLELMRRAGKQQAVYAKIAAMPKEEQRLFGTGWLLTLCELDKTEEAYGLYADDGKEKLDAGYGWLSVLVRLDKFDEAQVFLTQYETYCSKKYGDGAYLNITSSVNKWMYSLHKRGEGEVAYNLFRDAPQRQLQGGSAWLEVLAGLGKTEEAEAFFKTYEPYCHKTYDRDDAARYITRAKRVVKRLKNG